jgi:hypothetical protein
MLPFCRLHCLTDHTKQARTLRDVDLWSLKTSPYNGEAMEPAYTPHPFKGTEPTAEIEGAKIYTGSCHCGNVTVALKTKGELSEGHEYIQECNCSICSRVCFFLRPLSLNRH